MWKGDQASFSSKHEWARRNFEPMQSCELCGVANNGKKRFDWSNKNHTYRRIREDWQHVCRSCHTIYDYEHNGRTKTASLNGKWSKCFDKCVSCSGNKRKHVGGGLCTMCFKRASDLRKRKKVKK